MEIPIASVNFREIVMVTRRPWLNSLEIQSGVSTPSIPRLWRLSPTISERHAFVI
jgi:hypothetical protein